MRDVRVSSLNSDSTSTRNPQIGALICLMFLITTVGFVRASAATEFRATSQFDSFDDKLPEGSWSQVENWGGQMPRTAADVGIIGRGRSLSAGYPLGQAGDRPVIQIDPGGTLWFAHDFDQPLRLNGGQLRESPRRKDLCGSDIEITADSTITSQTNNDDAGRMRLAGKIWNSKPHILTLGGEIQWMTDAHSTLSTTLSIANGTLYLFDVSDTSKLGSGDLWLYPQTRLYLRGNRADRFCRLINNISGTGSLRAGDHPESFALSASGITLHPGLPGQAGTLSVMGNFGFEPGTANQPFNKIVIEVHGPGTFVEQDYSQLVLRGRLTDSLNTVDLELMVDPNLAPEEVQQYSLNVMSITDTDITRFKPFHSVLIRQGQKTGSAQVLFQANTVVSGSSVHVVGINLPN